MRAILLRTFTATSLVTTSPTPTLFSFKKRSIDLLAVFGGVPLFENQLAVFRVTDHVYAVLRNSSAVQVRASSLVLEADHRLLKFYCLGKLFVHLIKIVGFTRTQEVTTITVFSG